MNRGELWRGRDLIRLTATEAMLMRIFAARAHEPVTRQELVEDLGGGVAEAQERAVDVQITRLRRKIEDDPQRAALPADRARLRLHAGAGLTGRPRRLRSGYQQHDLSLHIK